MQVGRYAVSGGNARPWLATPVTTGNTTTTPKASRGGRGSKLSQQVLYAMFLTCAAMMEHDEFWKNIFTQAAHGKFPRGFIYRDGNLTYKHRNKIHSMAIGDNPVTALADCMNFFRNTAGLVSEADQERSRREREMELMEALSFDKLTWAEVKKKKKLHDVLISTYITEVADAMGLPVAEKHQLRTIINMGFILGCFSNERVNFVEGRIKGLMGLNYDSETRKFSIDPAVIPKTRSKRSSSSRKRPYAGPNQISFLELWTKFLETLEKRMSAPVIIVPTPVRSPILRLVTGTPGTPGTLIGPPTPEFLAMTPGSARWGMRRNSQSDDD